MKCFRFATTKSASTLHDRIGVCKVVYQICNKFASEANLMQIQICKRFCFNFAYCDHGNERYTMGVNFLQISCMLICKNETNLVNVIFTMTLLITLRVRKSVFSSRVYTLQNRLRFVTF